MSCLTMHLPTRGPGDRLVAGAVWGVALVITAFFSWIVIDLLVHGLGGLSWGFMIESPQRAGRGGGVGSVIVSSFLVLGVCLGVAVPAGVATAVFLAEFTRRGRWFGAVIGASLDVLAAVPSIVFGLFGNAFFVVWLGLGYSVLSGGLTLACMVLPILIRSTEAGLRAVPDDYRRAAAALGLSRTRSVASILLPAAIPGVAVGLVLGIGRTLAETAALLFTSGYVDRMPQSLLDSGRTLSVHIYDLAMNVPGGEPKAYTTAVVLVALLLVINAAAVWTAGRMGSRIIQA